MLLFMHNASYSKKSSLEYGRSSLVSIGSQLAHLLYIFDHWFLFVFPILTHGSSYGCSLSQAQNRVVVYAELVCVQYHR